jgi:cytidylate kinase
MTKPLIIAIDGPAAAGKGTLARRLAAHLGLPYLDTGLLYRATGRRVLDTGADPHDPVAAEAAARALRPEDTQRADLRGPPADGAAAAVAAIPGVRAALLEFQRNFGRTHGAVLDGRDIGTVVFPDATHKLFVTASAEARGQRRHRELRARGVEADLQDITREIVARDLADATREAAPLKPAPDAKVLDTTALDTVGTYVAALSLIGLPDILRAQSFNVVAEKPDGGMTSAAPSITLSNHTMREMGSRRIMLVYIESALAAPDTVTPDSSDPALSRSFKAIGAFGNRVLRVVHRPHGTGTFVVTAHWDRGAKP